MGCYCFKDNMNIGLYLCNYSGQSLTLFEADMTPSFKNYFFEKNLQLGAPWSLMMFTINYLLFKKIGNHAAHVYFLIT